MNKSYKQLDQNLAESIDIATLPSIQFASKNLRMLPAIAAIYFCLDSSNTLIYIGETGNLLHRWNLQNDKLAQCKEMKVTKLAWWETKCEYTGKIARRYRLDIETELIRLHRPILNFTIRANKKLYYEKVITHSPQG